MVFSLILRTLLDFLIFLNLWWIIFQMKRVYEHSTNYKSLSETFQRNFPVPFSRKISIHSSVWKFFGAHKHVYQVLHYPKLWFLLCNAFIQIDFLWQILFQVISFPIKIRMVEQIDFFLFNRIWKESVKQAFYWMSQLILFHFGEIDWGFVEANLFFWGQCITLN